MSPGQNFMTRVGLGQQFMFWVWIWKIPPKNVKFFNFCPLGQNKSLRVGSKAGWPLIFYGVKSKLGSGQSPSLIQISTVLILVLEHSPLKAHNCSVMSSIYYHKSNLLQTNHVGSLIRYFLQKKLFSKAYLNAVKTFKGDLQVERLSYISSLQSVMLLDKAFPLK